MLCNFVEHPVCFLNKDLSRFWGILMMKSPIFSRSVIYNGVNASTGDLFVIADSDGKPALIYKMPRTIRNMAVFFSSEDILSGGKYTVSSGGSLSGNNVNWNGWFEDGTYTDGVELGSFTSNGINTTVGQGSGPGGPGIPPGPGGPR